MNQTLLDLFSHSQRVYFDNRYYIKTYNYPEFEAWHNFMQTKWHASLHAAKIYNVVICNPAQHRWGYLITIQVKSTSINHQIITKTRKVAQQMLNGHSQKPVRSRRITELFLNHNQLFVIIKQA